LFHIDARAPDGSVALSGHLGATASGYPSVYVGGRAGLVQVPEPPPGVIAAFFMQLVP